MSNSPFKGGLAGSEFFKPKEHANAAAILIEVKRTEAQVMVPGHPEWGPKDYVHADISVFNTEAEVQNKVPNHVFLNGRIEGNLAASMLRGGYGPGDVDVARISQRDTNKGNAAWIWVEISPANQAFVAEYLSERDASVASALADDDTPDWMKE